MSTADPREDPDHRGEDYHTGRDDPAGRGKHDEDKDAALMQAAY